MTGFSAEFEYPSQKAKLKPQARTQHAESGAVSQIGHNGLIEYKKKNGSQQAIKDPIISPRMRVALKSEKKAHFR